MSQPFINSDSRLLIYIPSYNCGQRLLGVIDEIPNDIWQIADVLVVDNRSHDDSVAKIIAANQAKRWPKFVDVVQPEQNLGYSGSQKLAYQIFLNHPQFEWVMMLHGDGQYDARLIQRFLVEQKTGAEVIYGYRSWWHFWQKDETPFHAYLAIKLLSLLENLVTFCWHKEWHSGMVMYKRSFLQRVNFTNITESMHIDGHLLFAATRLSAKAKAIPIYKRYKDYPAIGPTYRLGYVLKVLRLMPKMHMIPIRKNMDENISAALPAFQLFRTGSVPL